VGVDVGVGVGATGVVVEVGVDVRVEVAGGGGTVAVDEGGITVVEVGVMLAAGGAVGFLVGETNGVRVGTFGT
jgi:hypothetical protein